MLELLASLVAGPVWRRQPMSARGWVRLLACAPLLAGCAAMVLAASLGGVLARPGWQAVMLAAGATLAAFVLALPVVLAGVSEVWLLPLVISLGAGAAGWALLPVSPGLLDDGVRACVLTLPVMVYGLGVACRRVTQAEMRAAAAAGAGPVWRARLFVAMTAYGVLAACGVVFVLALGIVGGGLGI